MKKNEQSRLVSSKEIGKSRLIGEEIEYSNMESDLDGIKFEHSNMESDLVGKKIKHSNGKFNLLPQ